MLERRRARVALRPLLGLAVIAFCVLVGEGAMAALLSHRDTAARPKQADPIRGEWMRTPFRRRLAVSHMK
jgi:hypothetical protein